MSINFRVKSTFFDRRQVIDRAGKARVRVLSKLGAFVRRTARTLTRKKQTKSRKVSAPGLPPLQHTGDLRRLIFFAYDKSSRGVVIGPEPFRKGEAPRLLEYGGRARRRRRRNGKTVTYTARYTPRPFMGPALDKERPKLAAMFKDQVR